MEKDTVSIKGIDKAVLLAALYNAARPLGVGFLRADSDKMTPEEARGYLQAPETQDNGPLVCRQTGPYFDYLKGRPLKIDLSGDELETRLYNRDQGPRQAELVVAALRALAEGGQQ